MATKCECQHETTFVSITKDLDRWRPLIDGNGKEPIGIRLRLIEESLTNKGKAMEELTNAQELTRRSLSALMKAEEFRAKHEADAKQTRRYRTVDIIQMIGLVLVAVQLFILMVKG